MESLDYFQIATEFQNMENLFSKWEEEGLSQEEQLKRIKVYIKQSIDYYYQLGG